MSSINHSGITLAYEEAGSGPSIFCIHGAMADSSHFAEQLNYFGGSHRVVAVDLRGHGESDKPHDDYTINIFADDCALLAREIGLNRSVIVGHSMGGIIALDFVARYPELAYGIIILDSPIMPPPAFADALKPFVASLKTPAYRDSIRMFIEQFIGFADQPERRASLLERLSSVPQHVVAAELESYISFETDDIIAQCNIPISYISSGPNFSDLPRFKELCPQLITGQTIGSGHYHQLEVPGQINAMIERFIELYSPNSESNFLDSRVSELSTFSANQ